MKKRYYYYLAAALLAIAIAITSGPVLEDYGTLLWASAVVALVIAIVVAVLVATFGLVSWMLRPIVRLARVHAPTLRPRALIGH